MSEGLKIESAASVILRDVIAQHMRTFAHVIQHDRAAGQSVVSAYIDGLAGALAFIIAGGHAEKEIAIPAAVELLNDAVARDLQHLRRQ